jgi:hypothetical protein
MSGGVALNRLERTGTDAFPYINTSSFRVPDATLGVQGPVDVELPDTRCVADDSWHVVDSWNGFDLGGGSGSRTRCGGVVH